MLTASPVIPELARALLESDITSPRNTEEILRSPPLFMNGQAQL